MTLGQLKLDLQPANLTAEARRLWQKWSRRLRRDERRVVTLEPSGAVRGRVLHSYVLEPFLLPDPSAIPYSHTHFWESWTIAETWRALGYRVDCVAWTNNEFVPAYDYEVIIDVRTNLERWAPLQPAALKVLHIDTGHHSYNNPAQACRHRLLVERSGAGALQSHKMLPANRGIEVADCGTVLGNGFTQGTYAFAGKPLLYVPVSVPFVYDWPAAKDFDAVRRRFLWFGSGGLVHKGLDLVLEAFAGLPGFELTVCGPIRRERDFERTYFRELYQTPNIRVHGWVDVAPASFAPLADRHLGLLYPSCCEGGGASVLTCMHAGLIPLVNHEVSVDVDATNGVPLARVDVASLRDAVRALAERPASELTDLARGAWRQARAHHSQEIFRAAYERAARQLIDGSWRQVAPPAPLDPRELSLDIATCRMT